METLRLAEELKQYYSSLNLNVVSFEMLGRTNLSTFIEYFTGKYNKNDEDVKNK